MKPEELIGRTITNIYETKALISKDGIPGPASFFNIVIELEGSDLYELGVHEISKWTNSETLFPFQKPFWAVQNKFNVIGEKIAKVIQKDPEEYYDGSLALLLGNNIF